MRLLPVLLLLALLALVAAPGTVLAAEAPLDVPEAIVDPPSAFQEQEATIDLADAEPAAAAAPSAARAPQAPTRGGGTSASSFAPTAASIAARGPSPTTQLPFTGIDSGLAIALGLLGAVLLCGGATLLALPSAPARIDG